MLVLWKPQLLPQSLPPSLHKAQFKTLLFEHVKYVASIQSEWNELCLCVNIMLLQERNSLLERNLIFK